MSGMHFDIQGLFQIMMFPFQWQFDGIFASGHQTWQWKIPYK